MIQSFSEERFPLRVSFGTSGGPERRTEIVRLSTGYETRNQRHRHAVRRYDAGSGVRSLSDLRAVVAFFEARRGSLTGFRFRDPLDNCSAASGAPAALDQTLETGDGARTAFPLVKRYGDGPDGYLRPIEKPVAGSLVVAVDGVVLGPEETTLDPTTGIVRFAEAPGDGAAVSAGFSFDVPVRFDLDHLAISIEAFEAGQIPTIPLVEIRP